MTHPSSPRDAERQLVLALALRLEVLRDEITAEIERDESCISDPAYVASWRDELNVLCRELAALAVAPVSPWQEKYESLRSMVFSVCTESAETLTPKLGVYYLNDHNRLNHLAELTAPDPPVDRPKETP